jgi:hypothetical protein
MSGTWIVMSGKLLETERGGGLELCGPFATEAAAQQYRQHVLKNVKETGYGPDICLAVELLNPPADKE